MPSLIDTKSRFTDLVPGWAPSSATRAGQVARLQSHLDRARRQLAGRHLEQLALFRRPRLDATSRTAQDWLDSILLPDDPPEVSFLVAVVTVDSGRREGIWRGFGRGLFGATTLRIEDDECGAATLHVAPSGLLSVEILELRWESRDDDGWYDG